MLFKTGLIAYENTKQSRMAAEYFQHFFEPFCILFASYFAVVSVSETNYTHYTHDSVLFATVEIRQQILG